MKWIDDDLLLEGERVLLKPLRADEIDELIKVVDWAKLNQACRKNLLTAIL